MASFEITREAWLRNQERFRSAAAGQWTQPFERNAYENRSPELSAEEQEELRILIGYFEAKQRGPSAQMITTAASDKTPLTRLVVPLCDALDILGSYGANRLMTLRVLLQETHRRQMTYWGWTRESWLELICRDSRSFQRIHHAPSQTRQYLIAACYLIADCVDFRPLSYVNLVSLANLIFGKESVQSAIHRVAGVVRQGGKTLSTHFPQLLAQILLTNHCPLLEAVRYDTLEALYTTSIAPARQAECVQISRALVRLRIIERPLERAAHKPSRQAAKKPTISSEDELPPDVPSAWALLCRRWRNEASPDLSPATRRTYYHYLFKVGRWLQQEHPTAGDPSVWTDDLAEECARMVSTMRVGEWTHPAKTQRWASQKGRLLAQETRDHYLLVLSIFFQECTRKGWVTLAFDPDRYFFSSTPFPGHAQTTSADGFTQ